MPVNYNFKKGVDLPSWHWLSPCPAGNSLIGTSNCYDGARFIYWAIQTGSTAAGTASTTTLWRFDTWNNGWQQLATLTSGGQGMDLEFDSVRNCVVYIPANGTLTAMQVFNLNPVSITYAGTVCAAWAATTLALVLPATAGAAASLTMPDENQSFNGSSANALDTLSTLAGSTATVLNDSLVVSAKPAGTFGPGMVGLYVKLTAQGSGSSIPVGTLRQITAVGGPAQLTVAALPAAPVAGDTFQVQVPQGTATGTQSSTTLADTGQAWITNQYANSDVIILSGTGANQRRRIASNTATALTLAAATTGNARTGAWTTTPDATSVYLIVPSSDFMYYQPGNASTGLYRLDVVATTGAWSAALAAATAPGGGANTMFAGSYDPFAIIMAGGGATKNIFRYGIGPNAWTTLTTFWGSETITTGASVAMMHARRRLFIQKEGQTRCYAHDFTTGQLEPAGFLPYANPAAYDGKRARFVRTPSGVEWVYLFRAGGQEFYRVPVEWIA